MAATAWKNTGNGFQSREVDERSEYRVAMAPENPPFNISDILSQKPDVFETFSELSLANLSSKTVLVNDPYRGGLFVVYDGGSPVDYGVIFPTATGKVKRVIQGDEILLQWWGVDGTGVSDNTANVNYALDFCATNGYKYLNITGTIKITNRLNDSKNKVIFVGNGTLNNAYKNNYAETEISDSEVTFSGAINKAGLMPKTVNILAKSQSLKIVAFGDSIFYGQDYNTQNPNGSFFEIVNNETNENSLYGNLIRQIQKRFYDKDITVFNRAIPGQAISAYESIVSSLSEIPAWYVSGMSGKSWIDIMEDDAPDVILIQHGMNSGSDYAKYAIQFVDLINAWAKVPEIVFISTPALNYINLLSVDWAGLPRLNKLDISNQQYNLANFYRSYLIDVSRVANIKRYGCDFRNFTFKPRSLNSFSFTNGAGVIDGGKIGIPSAGTVTMLRNSQTPKFYLSFGFEPSSSFSSFRITVGESYVIFSPSSVTIYPYTTDVGDQLPPSTGSITLSASVVYNLKIQYGDFLEVYLGNELIVTSKVCGPVVNITDDVVIDIQGSTGISEISNFVYYEAEFRRYKPTLTGTDLWGEAGFGNNGNAINHPSLLGVNETYNQAVGEFIDYLFNCSSNLKYQNLQQTLAVGNASTLGIDIPYAIFRNGSNSFSLENNGSGIGMVDLTAAAFRWMLKANGIFELYNTPEYADNAAAITGGLSVGAFYRTGDLLKVVH